MPATADEPGYSPEALACYAAAASKYARTADFCRAPAAAGDPHALVLLAERTQAPQRRVELLHRAAQQDYPPALVALGDALQRQARVFEAEDLYFRAADLDYGPGMQRVVQILLDEAGTQDDFERIRLMLLAPAKDGYADAAYDVALMFRDGIGGEADLEAARQWMFEAATSGHVPAQYELAMALTHTEPGQSLRWLVKAARAGSNEAMYELAAANTDGVMTPQNFDEALYWGHEAIKAGHPDAERLLAEIEWRRDNPGIRRSAFHLTPHGDDGVIDEVLPDSLPPPARPEPPRALAEPELETSTNPAPSQPDPPAKALPVAGGWAADARGGATGADGAGYIVDWQIELNTGQQK